MEVVDLPILAIDMELIRVKHPSWLDFVGGGYSNEFITIFTPPINANSWLLDLENQEWWVREIRTSAAHSFILHGISTSVGGPIQNLVASLMFW